MTTAEGPANRGMNRLVSIVIPCFNAEGFVGEAIASALGQTYPQKEVIVIDDGSTDGSLDVIRSFGDAIRWETGPNRGGCAARNRGLELARGELIQFLDADDLLRPEKLERQVAAACEDPQALVYCDYEWLAADASESEGLSCPAYRGEDPVVFILRKTGLQTSAPLHWRENLNACGGFRETLPCAQERDLHLRLACMGLTFRHLPEVLYTVRRRAGSVSSDSLRVLDQHLEIALGARELLRRQGSLTDERAAAIAAFLTKDARHLYRLGRPERAREYLSAAKGIHVDGGIPQVGGSIARMLQQVCGTELTQRMMMLKWGFARCWHSSVAAVYQ